MFNEDSKTRQEIRRLQKKMKKSPLLFARLAECYLKLGDWDRAEKVLIRGVADHPDYVTGLLVLGEGYLYTGLHRDALECVEKGLQQYPNHMGLLRLKEKIKKQTEEEQDLQEVQDSIRSLDPLHTHEEVSVEAPQEERRKAEELTTLEDIAADLGFEGLEKIKAQEKTDEQADEPEEIQAVRLSRAANDEEETVAEQATAEEEITSEETTEEIPEIGSQVEEEPARKSTDPFSFGETVEEADSEAEETMKEIPEVRAEEEKPSPSTTADPFGLDASLSEEEAETEKTEEPPLEGADTAEDEVTPSSETEEEIAPQEVKIEKEKTEPKSEEVEEEEEPKKPKKKIATKTLGELYATQKKYDEAIEIYEKLIENDPNNEAYVNRLEELKSRREAALSESAESSNE